MGACCSNESAPDTQVADSKAMDNFLSGGELDELWAQFDKNNDGFIDGKEFKQLIYISLRHFCEERNPHSPPPTQAAMKPFIKKLVLELQPFVDQDKDTNITREEFAGYGTYLTAEFEKVQAELKKQN